MNGIFFVLFVLLFLYAVILAWLATGFIRTQKFFSSTKFQAPVTIIICARNEENTIAACLSSILKQDYDLSKVQLILVNDGSSDQTLPVAELFLRPSGLNYRIITNPTRLGKKQSITNAIAIATNELLIMRDADTYTNSDQWLQTLAELYKINAPDLIIAPVALAERSNLGWALQAIENNILAAIACGSSFYKKAFLCNGANLAFTKNIFEKVNGYSSHLDIPSGDDILFLEEVKKIPEAKIIYLKSVNAIVQTYAAGSLKDLVQQKIRWASKFKHNPSKLNFTLGFLTFFLNVAWVYCLADLATGRHLRAESFTFLFLKLLIDILLLFLASGFIKNKNLLWFTLPVGILYPFYAAVIGIGSIFFKPVWKAEQ